MLLQNVTRELSIQVAEHLVSIHEGIGRSPCLILVRNNLTTVILLTDFNHSSVQLLQILALEQINLVLLIHSRVSHVDDTAFKAA